MSTTTRHDWPGTADGHDDEREETVADDERERPVAVDGPGGYP